MRRAYPRSSMPDCNVRSNVTSPTNASVGNSTSPNAKNAPPTLVAVATSPRAINPPETDAKNMLARPVDSAIVAERAPCNVKCSVVMNETAEAGGSLATSPESWSVPIAFTPQRSSRPQVAGPLGEQVPARRCDRRVHPDDSCTSAQLAKASLASAVNRAPASTPPTTRGTPKGLGVRPRRRTPPGSSSSPPTNVVARLPPRNRPLRPRIRRQLGHGQVSCGGDASLGVVLSEAGDLAARWERSPRRWNETMPS